MILLSRILCYISLFKSWTTINQALTLHFDSSTTISIPYTKYSPFLCNRNIEWMLKMLSMCKLYFVNIV
ncbi:uncharacterized protein B0P05DRAFT_535649 [Gilbertella persicaria]|uniref:uncharacterized protein n=1 Tax=Gilbertella persicaria TaxID=101096 RepID=UPI00222106C1|nr:uncharacterized protein B0P05DRAFT_535649 [Gilbertella persicaria]KAI8083967.1 hypothetical protein B0P05DRAFT_535649 [Gilbertella persicaria]